MLVVFLALAWAFGLTAFYRIKVMADQEEVDLERKRKAREEAAGLKAKLDKMNTDWPTASQFVRARCTQPT